MKNEFDILWSKESKHLFDKIIHYLKKEWSVREADNFINELKNFERTVIKFPEIYPRSKQKPELRRAVVTKHNSVIYAIDYKSNLIRVYTIFDNRKQPDKLK